ncbi:MAG: copper chaperone PCu(A)C [Betaproteobacteria bacterium]
MKHTLIAALTWAVAGSALAQVDITSAWARSTVPGQGGTGAFMTIVAKDGGKLVGAASPVAGVVELHEMAMDNNVMKMRAIPALDLPAGREVQLKPGGYHVMLLDLKRPLKVGEKVRIELRLEMRDGKRVTQPVEAEVRSTPPGQDAHKH